MRTEFTYRGIYAPVLTPYKDNLEIDYDDLRKMVDFTVAAGNHGMVTTANAAEFYTLTDEEHHKVIKTIFDRNKGRIPIIVGAAAWSTEHCIYHSKFAESLGAAAIMSTPPVMKPSTWDEIRRFYHELDKTVNIPICIQNAPPMAPSLTPAEIIQLAGECEHIMYAKEETPFEMAYISELAEAAKKLPDEVFGGVMSGQSGLTFIDTYLRGACGSMPANHISDVFVTIWELLEAGKLDEAYRIHADIAPLLIYEGMYWGPNFNYIMHKRGVFKTFKSRARAPEYTAKHLEEVDHLLERAEKYYRA